MAIIRRGIGTLLLAAAGGFLGRAVGWKMEVWNLESLATFIAVGIVAFVQLWYYSRKLRRLADLFNFDELGNLCISAKGEEFKIADANSDVAGIVKSYRASTLDVATTDGSGEE